MAIPHGLVLALDLIRAPVLGEVMRRQPLPPSRDILILLRIAGDCPETTRGAVECTGESPEHVKAAAVHYLTQVLLSPDADSYRVLGVDRQASQATIRQHLQWMMKWLHPDRNSNRWESLFATRVLGAWEDLRSPQRRQAYDRLRNRADASGSPGYRSAIRGRGVPWISTPIPPRQCGRVWLGAVGLTFIVALTTWLLLSHRVPVDLAADKGDIDSVRGAPALAVETPAEPKGAGTRSSGNR